MLMEVTRMENIMNDLRWKNVTRLFSANEVDLGFSKREEWFKWSGETVMFRLWGENVCGR